MKKAALALVAMLVCSGLSYADIARPDSSPHHTPKPPPETLVDTTLDIRLDSDAKEAKLLIPRSQIKQLRAELDRLDYDGTSASATTNSCRDRFCFATRLRGKRGMRGKSIRLHAG